MMVTGAVLEPDDVVEDGVLDVGTGIEAADELVGTEDAAVLDIAVVDVAVLDIAVDDEGVDVVELVALPEDVEVHDAVTRAAAVRTIATAVRRGTVDMCTP